MSPDNNDSALRIHLVIATIGRAAILCQILRRLERQIRKPDRIVIVGVSAADVVGVSDACPQAHIVLADKGSCRQRNAALDLVADTADIVIYFDDDFLAADDYFEQVEQLMRRDLSIVGLTGHLVADGAHTSAIEFDAAAVALNAGPVRTAEPTHDCNSLYGCNMAVRMAADRSLRFDETLPLYGWQEDVDYSARLRIHGRLVRSRELTGIHLGAKSGRTSGLRFGYSQVANIFYLRRKRTIGFTHGFGLMARNIASNLSRSLWPEAGIDRRGRLHGNVLALADCLRGKVDPRRIESL